ncbi:thrombospondin-1-like [Haliotis cracherodii]|uniref:thrombospondin-1-like n=1 Tax=Haliotis cracherodii TaxID=6455 RepID=UPI0039E7F9F2
MVRQGSTQVNGGWSHWDQWIGPPCSATCGNLYKHVTRQRSCTAPPPHFGGSNCTGEDKETITRDCNLVHCPVDGLWAQWAQWNDPPCSWTCGGGSKNVLRQRLCTDPAPQYGGRECQGKAHESLSRSCNVHKCPVNGIWTTWGEWLQHKCSGECGSSSMIVTRSRTCTVQAPEYGGRTCPGDENQSSARNCNPKGCSASGAPQKTGDILILLILASLAVRV